MLSVSSLINAGIALVNELKLEVSKLSPKELLNIYIDMKEVLQHNVDLISEYDIKEKLREDANKHMRPNGMHLSFIVTEYIKEKK